MPNTETAGAGAKPERTPQDYAIEHAEYMAQDAERLLDTINHLNAQRDEDGDAFDSDALARAEEAVTEAFGSVRNGIYEFRKRRDRAAAQPAGAQQPGAAGLIGALEDAQRAINSMKVEAETAAQGDEQMMLEACETISNEGFQADMAIRAALASHGQAPAGATLPEGWVPLVITHEGQYPEEIAYGPQRMMDRLDKWLRKYFDSVVAAKEQSAPAADLQEDQTQPWYDLAWKHGARRHASFDGDELTELSFRPAQFDAFCAELAPAAGAVAPAAVAGPSGRLSDELRSVIEGMTVSVDVSTGDHDAGHRYFGTVTEVMDDIADKHGVTLLVQDAKPNFAAAPTTQPAPQQEAQEPVAGHCRFPGGAWAECSPEHVRMVRANSEEWKGYEVRYLYAEPQPSPAAQGDALDAARYRWLRERSSTMFVNISINGEGAEIAATLDSAVDAARAAQEGKSHG